MPLTDRQAADARARNAVSAAHGAFSKISMLHRSNAGLGFHQGVTGVLPELLNNVIAAYAPLDDGTSATRDELVAEVERLVTSFLKSVGAGQRGQHAAQAALLVQNSIASVQSSAGSAFDLKAYEVRKSVALAGGGVASSVAPVVTIGREGLLVSGQPFDAMLAMSAIIRTATKSVLVIDGYVDEQTLNLLRVKEASVAVRILTFPAKSPASAAAFVAYARAFQAQVPSASALEVRTSSKFHDRFIVLDDDAYYHFGASLKDAGKGKASMFSRIEEPAMVAALRGEIAAAWDAATILPL
jgi:hypothetical protein